jgi:hypothetical protein
MSIPSFDAVANEGTDTYRVTIQWTTETGDLHIRTFADGLTREQAHLMAAMLNSNASQLSMFNQEA